MSYRRELEKYRDLDEDEILGALTEEELRTLENELDELDPDNALLPAGLRQKDQTTKAPTGPFKREELLDHLEKQAKEFKDREDLVPYTGEKRGKIWVPKQKPMDPVLESVTLEPELEEALANASDAELCDIAAILGMHTLMSNQQYYQALGSSSIVNKEGLNSEYAALLGCHLLPLRGLGLAHRGLLEREVSPPASEAVLPILRLVPF